MLILKPAELKLPALTSLPTATEKGPKACHELEFSKGVRWFFGAGGGSGAGGGGRGPHAVTATPFRRPPSETRFADESMATAAAAVGRLTFFHANSDGVAGV